MTDLKFRELEDPLGTHEAITLGRRVQTVAGIERLPEPLRLRRIAHQGVEIDHGIEIARCPNPVVDSLAIGFVRRIVTDTAAEATIDPNRVYVGGFSAGASMAYRVMCDIPEIFAAVGAISGALVAEGCSPRADLSVVEIHGTKDELVPYAGCAPTTNPCGNRAMTAAPAEQMVARFRTFFGCSTPVVRCAH